MNKRLKKKILFWVCVVGFWATLLAIAFGSSDFGNSWAGITCASFCLIFAYISGWIYIRRLMGNIGAVLRERRKKSNRIIGDEVCQCQKCDPVITGSPEIGVWGFCRKCGTRTPCYTWYNGAWAVELLLKAKQEGTSWIDKSLIH